jgi:hypothetical protein
MQNRNGNRTRIAMASLRILRKRFSLALLDRTRGIPPGIRAADREKSKRYLEVYRDHVSASAAEALVARFPVCHALAGDELFRAMARLFIELSPPGSPILMTYGDDFGDFIETFPAACTMPYLGDVARLEAALILAHHAADASPLTVDELASFAPCRWDETYVDLHPSVRIITSSYPIISIWKAHIRPDQHSTIDLSVAEDALVARPDLEVEVHRLPPGAATFLSTLLKGAALRFAAEEAADTDPRFDLVTTLAGALASKIVVGLRSAEI